MKIKSTVGLNTVEILRVKGGITLKVNKHKAFLSRTTLEEIAIQAKKYGRFDINDKILNMLLKS